MRLRTRRTDSGKPQTTITPKNIRNKMPWSELWGGDNRSSAVADTLPRLIKMSELHERLGVSKRQRARECKRDGVEGQQITKVANKTAFKAL